MLEEILEERVVSSRGQKKPRGVKRKMSGYPLRGPGPISRRKWAKVLVADLLDERTSLWSVPHGVVVRRAATKMACVVRNMLRMARDIVFVDPYFSCSPDRYYVEVLAACLQACIEQRIPDGHPRVRILTADDSDDDSKCSHGFFTNQCRDRLPSRLPVGQQVEISRLKERTNGGGVRLFFVVPHPAGAGPAHA